jgi:hypothetical protein
MPALKAFQICMPPLPKQQRIVNRLKDQLSAWEAMYSGVRNRLSDIGLLPSRLLAEALDNT